jgi:hypothetical protein
MGYACDFFLAQATQRVKFHRIAGATEMATRAMNFLTAYQYLLNGTEN